MLTLTLYIEHTTLALKTFFKIEQKIFKLISARIRIQDKFSMSLKLGDSPNHESEAAVTIYLTRSMVFFQNEYRSLE